MELQQSFWREYKSLTVTMVVFKSEKNYFPIKSADGLTVTMVVFK